MQQGKLRSRFEKLKTAYGNRDENPEGYKYFAESLKEEGLKNLFITPLLQNFLGYEDVEDYGFETSLGTTKYAKSEAIDILLSGKYIIETKNFGLLENKKEFEKAQLQIRNYIRPDEDEYESGLLTDGISYYFYIDKKYIERKANHNEKLFFSEDLPLCINFRIDDKLFFDLILFFHKSVIEANLEKLSAGIVKTHKKKQGSFSWHKLFPKFDDTTIQSKCGEFIKNQISDIFRIKEGFYYKDIISGKATGGDVYIIDNEFFHIEYKVLENGFVEVLSDSFFIKPENQNKTVSLFPNILESMFINWPKNERNREYESPKQIIIELKGGKRITSELQKLIDDIKKK